MDLKHQRQRERQKHNEINSAQQGHTGGSECYSVCHSCKSYVGVCAADMHRDMQAGDVLTKRRGREKARGALAARDAVWMNEEGVLWGLVIIQRRENYCDKWMLIWHMSDLLNSLVSIKTITPTQNLSWVYGSSHGRENRNPPGSPNSCHLYSGTHVSSCAASVHAHMPQNKTDAWNISPVESHFKKTKKQNGDSIEGDRSSQKVTHIRGNKRQSPGPRSMEAAIINAFITE